MPAMSIRRVLVTGSSRGIGAAIARRLASEGWEVALHFASDRDAAERVALELGGATRLYGEDLVDPSRAASLFERVQADGPLTALVNNAGIYRPLSFLDAGEHEFEANLAQTMAVNFESPLRLARAAARAFAQQGDGAILNVASRVGFRGEAGAALYAASKAALINLTRSLAVELAPRGVRSFGIAPGWVETAMARPGMDERLPQILRDIPLGRVASPEDCANAAAFLLREESAYLSGVIVDINGASYFH